MKSSVVLSYWLIVGDSRTVAVLDDSIKPNRRFLAKAAKRDENVSNDLQNPSLLDFYVQPMFDAPPLVSNDVDVSVDSESPSTTSTTNSEVVTSSMTGGLKVTAIPSHVLTTIEAIKPTTLQSGIATSFGTSKPSKSPTTSPSVATALPTIAPSTKRPSKFILTSSKPTKSTESPTNASTTSRPLSLPPTTNKPTKLPTSSPTISPTTMEPTKSPTAFPMISLTTSHPTIASPTTAESTESPTELPTNAATTSNPTTPSATLIITTTSNPTTSSPSESLSKFPTVATTSIPTIVELSKSPFLPPYETKNNVSSSQVGATENPSSAPSETLGGTIWYDANENGTKDDDENGVAGITIQAKSCNGDRLVAFAFSESDGTYCFSNIGPAGACYYLQFPSASDKHNMITVPNRGRTEDILLGTNGEALSLNAGIVLKHETESAGEGPMKSSTTSKPSALTTSETTLSPSPKHTTSVPTTSFPTSLKPATHAPSKLATKKPTTSSPATSEPTLSPSSQPMISVPTTSFPTSLKPQPAANKPPTSSPATSAPTTSPPSEHTTSSPVINSPTHSPSFKLAASEPITSSPTSLAPTFFPSFKPTATSEPTAAIAITAEPTESLSIVDVTTSQNTSTTQQSSESKPTVTTTSRPKLSQIPSNLPSGKPISVTNTSNLNSKQETTNPSMMQYTSVPDVTTHSGIPSDSSSLYSNGTMLSMRPSLNPSRLQASSRSPTTLTSSSKTRTSRPSNVPTLNLSEQTPSKITSYPPSVRSRQDNLDASTEQEKLEGSDTTLIIMTIAGVATLTMLAIVIATQKRRKHEALAGPPTPVNNSALIPCGTNDNQDGFIFSTITGWTDCAQIVIQVDSNDVPLEKSSELQSAAEINCRGTMTLEKEGNSVVPGSWLNALHAGDSREGPSELEASSVDDTSTENFSDSNQGGFPRYIDGSFPTEYAGHVSKYLDSSHIGTLDEHDIEQASSQETEESKSSLNRFISDLVWLEQKIADEIAQEAAIVAVNEKDRLKNELRMSDSYSYECEPYSPRSLSDVDSTVESVTNSQARSIVCRDCYIPPGILDIEITSTKDGPIISEIRDDSLADHFKVGDLIMALDDRDTRCLTAKQMDDILSYRSTFQRKLTLLQFGGVRE